MGKKVKKAATSKLDVKQQNVEKFIRKGKETAVALAEADPEMREKRLGRFTDADDHFTRSVLDTLLKIIDVYRKAHKQAADVEKGMNDELQEIESVMYEYND